MRLLEDLSEYTPALLIALLIATLIAAAVFTAMFYLTSALALGIDFMGWVGLPIAAAAGIGAFVIALRTIRPSAN